MRVPLNREEAKGNSAGTVFLSLIRQARSFQVAPEMTDVMSPSPVIDLGHAEAMRKMCAWTIKKQRMHVMSLKEGEQQQILNFILEMKRNFLEFCKLNLRFSA